MARIPSTNQQAEIVKTITTPYFLIDLMLDIPLYFSTRNIVTCDGKEYQTDRTIEVGSIEFSKSGSVTSNITFSNLDNVMSIVMLLSKHDINVKIRYTYMDASTIALNDTVLLFSGQTNGFKVAPKKLSLPLVSKDLICISPGVVISKENFSYLVAKGTIIKSGNTTITLN